MFRLSADWHCTMPPSCMYHTISCPFCLSQDADVDGSGRVLSSPYLQRFFWRQAGFDKLRHLSGLEDVDARYDPTVIRTYRTAADAVGSESVAALLEEDWSQRKPSGGVYPSVFDYHEAYKAGRITPTDVAKALLPLIRKDVKNPTKHSVAFLDSKEELVLKAAAASSRRYREGIPLSPLDGVPVAVKDEEDVAGYTRSCASRLDVTNKDDATSYCVQAWQDAGAVLIGKTNMHEFGMDTTNNNPHRGTPRNPYNDMYYTGGSSGGSAYATAAGLVPVSMGNDGGGSVRLPCCFCGLFGLKPSQGRVSIRPTSNLAKSNGVAGPMTANMADLEIAYRIMAQPDALDHDARLFIPPSSTSSLPSRTKVLGIYPDWFAAADPPVRKACQSAIDYLTTKCGYSTVNITIPFLAEAQMSHSATILAEIISGVALRDIPKLTPANQLLMAIGSQTSAVHLLQAQKIRQVLMQHLSHLYEQHPRLIIVTPTVPTAGWPFEEQDLTYGYSHGPKTVRSMEYCYVANFTGCPAITAPVGYVEPVTGSGKVPVGLMGMGEWCAEDELIAFGYDVEKYLNERYEGGRQRAGNWVDVLALAQEGVQ